MNNNAVAHAMWLAGFSLFYNVYLHCKIVGMKDDIKDEMYIKNRHLDEDIRVLSHGVDLIKDDLRVGYAKLACLENYLGVNRKEKYTKNE